VNDAFFLEACRAAEAASSGAFACHVIDVGGKQEWAYQSDLQRPAASIVKVPVLIELFARADKGQLSLDGTLTLKAPDKVGGAGVLLELHDGLPLTLRDLAILMTVVSDNTASNMLIDRLGMDAINRRIETIGMPQTVLGRKFMIDPNALHAKNFTSARDMAHMFARLLRGELLGPSATEEVIGILKRQQYREKLPLLLPEDLPVAHKTGEISGTRHDAGLVLLPGRPYAICCMTWDLQDVLAGDRAIAEVSRALHQQISDLAAIA